MKLAIRAVWIVAVVVAPQALAQSVLGVPLMYYDDGSPVPLLVASPCDTSGAALNQTTTGSLTNICTSLARGRDGQTATLVDNGRVLIAGGRIDTLPAPQYAAGCAINAAGLPGPNYCPPPLDTVTATTEEYHPTANLFLPTATMLHARAFHLAVRLNNGQVLIVGGTGVPGDDPAATAELYDPLRDRFTATGSPAVPRTAGATATLLSNGKVLVIGGAHCGGAYPEAPYTACSTPTAAVELYDPATGRFTSTGSLATARQWHAAVRLANGKVLVTGGVAVNGSFLASAELYDPSTGSFSPAGTMSAPRAYGAAAPLPGGRVLIAGVAVDPYQYGYYFGAAFATDVYDPSTGLFAATASPTDVGVGPDSLVPLYDGRVFAKTHLCSSFDLYEPASGQFAQESFVYPQITNVGYHQGFWVPACETGTATLLQSGKLLLTGGWNQVWPGPGYADYYYEHYKRALLFKP